MTLNINVIVDKVMQNGVKNNTFIVHVNYW